MREIERMQPALEAAVELGIRLSQLGDLARYGLLLPDSGPEIDGCNETKFSRKTWPTFSTASVTSLRRPAPTANTMSFLSGAWRSTWNCTN